MDPGLTQSAQISSSQGSGDGHHSAAKESKLSVGCLAEESADKKAVAGTDKPSESVATSLRFPSQPGSFSTSNCGSEVGAIDEQDSPIKTSPVSERIKALEALAAKKTESNFRGDGNFSHFRDRHEKFSSDGTKLPPKPPIDLPKPAVSFPKPSADVSKLPSDAPKVSSNIQRPTAEVPIRPIDIPKLHSDVPVASTEKVNPSVQKFGGSIESPESPFEILGEIKPPTEFEETEEWMKAHLPPVMDVDSVGLVKGCGGDPLKEVPEAPTAFASVPDAFMDSPIQSPKQMIESIESKKEESKDEEFDMNFLPTAFMWDQQDKTEVHPASNFESSIQSLNEFPMDLGSSSSQVSPPASFSDVKHIVEDDKRGPREDFLDHRTTSEAESSGESDDTVIEDTVCAPQSEIQSSMNTPHLSDAPPTADFAAPDLSSCEKITPPPKSERKLMQVPTINVIETDDPDYSDEEMDIEPPEIEDEDYDPVKDAESEDSRAAEPEPPIQETEPQVTRPLQTEMMEGYSPPSSPVDSDAGYSPKHKINEPVPEAEHKPSPMKSDLEPDIEVAQQAQNYATPTSSNQTVDDTNPVADRNEEVEVPDNDNKWPDEIQDDHIEPEKTGISSQELVSIQKFGVNEQTNTTRQEAYNESTTISGTGFMQDDIYDRQSFDYEFDEPPPLHHVDDQSHGYADREGSFSRDKNDVQEDIAGLDSDVSQNDDEVISNPAEQPTQEEYPQNPYSCVLDQAFAKPAEKDTKGVDKADLPPPNEQTGIPAQTGKDPNPSKSATASTDADMDTSLSESTDSFADFMRECLKSRQDGEPNKLPYRGDSKSPASPPCILPGGTAPDPHQEKQSIAAVKEPESGQDEHPVNPRAKDSDQNPVDPADTAAQLSSVAPSPSASSSQSTSAFVDLDSTEAEAIDEWMAEAFYLAEHVLTAILTYLSVKDLVHWRDPKKSGVVFGLSMLMLLSLAAFSVISVISYLLLALLTVTISFRIYKSVVQAVQKSSEGHPFKALIDKDVTIPPETFRKHVDASLTYINRALKQMSHLFLVEDLVDSLKLAVVMWLLTYVGAVFNGITLLILADILLFAVPPIYEKNKTQIDQYIELVRSQVNATVAKLQEKLPGAVKRSKAE